VQGLILRRICSELSAGPNAASVGECRRQHESKPRDLPSPSQQKLSAAPVQGDLGRDAGRRLLRELEVDGGWDAVYALYSGNLEPSALVSAPLLIKEIGAFEKHKNNTINEKAKLSNYFSIDCDCRMRPLPDASRWRACPPAQC